LFDASGNGNNMDLGSLGGCWVNCAFSINESTQIVGMADNTSGYFHATLFDTRGQGNNIDLGTLSGNWSWANSINDSGQIVGWTGPEMDPYYGGRAILFFRRNTTGGNP
jgi:probable HAF family extracellular repeat protein